MKIMLKNEFKKTYNRYITLVMLLFMCILSFCCVFINKKTRIDSVDIDLNWRQIAQSYIDNVNFQLKDTNITYEEKQILLHEIEVFEMYLDLNVAPSDWRRNPLNEYWDLYLIDNRQNQESQQLLKTIKQDDWKSYYKEQQKKLKLELLDNDITQYERIEKELDIESIQLRLSYDIKPCFNELDWKNKCLANYSSLKLDLLLCEVFPTNQDYKLTPEIKSQKENEATICLYRLTNNVKPNNEISMAKYLSLTTSSEPIFLAIIVALFSNIFYIEYKHATIKQLLIYNKPRKKIYYSKLLFVVIIAFILLCCQFLISTLVGVVAYKGYLSPKLLIINSSVVSLNYIIYIFIKYMLIFAHILCYAVFGQLLTIIYKSVLIGVGLTLCIPLLVNPCAKYLYSNYGFSFLYYLPSLHLDFCSILDQEFPVFRITLQSSSIIFLAILILCIFVSKTKFTKQDA